MEKNVVSEDIIDILLGKTVLIVEDDEFIFNLFEIMLSGTGIRILHADDGEKALSLVENQKIDIILLDIRLPGQNGFEIFREIKQMRSDIPIVAQTANHQPGEKERFLSAGFDDYITKPVNTETIQNLIFRLVSKSR